MLAPLFRREPAPNNEYPPEVMAYLRSVPPGESPARGTRLEQLLAEWAQAGRVGPPATARRDQTIRLLTTMNTEIKVSISELSNRIAMLDDVRSVVGLMVRDLADLMQSLHPGEKDCMH